MNMMLLTGLSVALALSVMTTNNFYVDKVTTASINQFNEQTLEHAKNTLGTDFVKNPINNIKFYK